MSDKSKALALAQLLLLHADTIENPDIQNMIIDAATELTILHGEYERYIAMYETQEKIILVQNKMCDMLKEILDQ